MKLSEMFPRKYATGEDLAGRPATLVISKITCEKMRPDPRAPEVEKYVLYFEKATRGIILNRTIAEEIAAIVGSDDTNNWPGCKVTLYPLPLVVAGKQRVAIRAKAPANGEDDPPPQLMEDEDI